VIMTHQLGEVIDLAKACGSSVHRYRFITGVQFMPSIGGLSIAGATRDQVSETYWSTGGSDGIPWEDPFRVSDRQSLATATAADV